VSVPSVRASTAASKWYPSNFAGWDDLADAVRAQQRTMPAGTRIVADDFKLGAELGFALGDADIAVLDHPLNHKHGRAPQLRLWGLQASRPVVPEGAPMLLVVGATEVSYKDLLRRYHDLCAMVGPLPPPHVLNIDHGRQRFLLFAIDGSRQEACTTPAMAWIDVPVTGASVGRTFAVTGWAFKDGVGLASAEILLDGYVVAQAQYGRDYPGLQSTWTDSNDPQHPRVGFSAQVDLRNHPGVAPGRHWLGLRLHGRDGSIEDWSEQAIRVGR
jgi:hypothetical protein